GLYLETNRYNYSPVWAHVLLGLDTAAWRADLTLAQTLGAFLLLFDAATALILARLAGGGRRGAAAALLFFANPVSIFVSSFHLQFDGVAIFFLLVALWCAERPVPRRGGAVAALSASLLVKHVTVFFPPLFLRGRRRDGLSPLAVVVPYAVFAAAFLPYARQWTGIRRNVFGYRSLAEDYGTAMLRKIPGAPDWLPTLVFAAAIVAALVLLRGVELPRACLLLSLVMLLTVPGIAEYYFVWPIALGALSGGIGYVVYTLVVTAFYMGSPDALNLPLAHLPGWHGVWWSVLLWLALEVRRLGRERAAAPA
ncbi:MAG: hypothetical protein ACM3NW_10670, partial [Syntrophomonadaceae bacterium]